MNEHNRDADINSTIAGLLRDMATAQQSPQRQWGYKQAGKAIRGLDLPVDELVLPDGTLARIPHIGPASTRIILEVLSSGRSETVERAIDESGRRTEVERRRAWRGNFLSRAAARRILTRDHRLAGYRGDLQMHSTWSDGSQTLDAIAAGCMARGYAYAAVTDHSGGLPIAGGLSTERLAAQAGEIERVNQAFEGRFRLLRGVEANIRADGEVDVDPRGSPAARDRRRRPAFGPAVGAAANRPDAGRVSSPGVHILGHPRGRMYGSRPGVAADWPRIFETAARTGVAIEIDGDPSRQDLDFELARQARDAGCLFALDSDAHSVAQLAYAEIAMAHALLAGLPAEHVINCWPLERLLEWAASRQR